MSEGAWKTMAICCGRNGRDSSNPGQLIDPGWSASTSPAIRFNKVDLPLPERPTNAMLWPARILKSTDEIALISGGRIVARDTAEGLKRTHGVGTLEEVYLRTVAGGRIAINQLEEVE